MAKGNLAVIGGGVSGMVAAIFAKRNGANVTVFDTNPTLGRKLLKTGAGRCNFANEDTNLKHYHSRNIDYVKNINKKFDLTKIIEFLNSIGIVEKSVNGWLYPNSMQARSVRDCLLMEMQILGINLCLQTKVSAIIPEENAVVIDTNRGVARFDSAILATGGMASPDSGSDGVGLNIARELGINTFPMLPALCPLISDDKYLKLASGIRTDCKLSMEIEGKKFSETGNLQITDSGISGICTMQLSIYVSQALYEKRKVKMYIDFLPDYKKSEINRFLKERFTEKGRAKSCASTLIGLIPDKLIKSILQKSGIRPDLPAGNITGLALDELAKNLKEYEINIVDVSGFKSSQSSIGGVSLEELDKNTLISKQYKNLGFCGEILDVCGDCGGYNISWAIASGATVGSNILGGA